MKQAKSTAIITGASRGIGRACALYLAKHFDCIVIIARTNDKALQEVKQSIENTGCECHAFLGNVGDHTFVQKTINEILSKNVVIDLLVNNAGISFVGLLTDMTITDWNQIVETNLTSVFNMCHQVVPHMVSNHKGCIINISSMWGLSGASCEVAYSATKGGVNAFTQGLAKELAPSGISVNAIACGTVDTDMNACFSEEEKAALCEDIPLGKMATTEEVAEMIYHIYQSPKYLTGEIIKFDGGYL